MPLENNIKLSIIIPVYNEDRYILKLLKELKIYFNINTVEILIVDDGSTDNSLEIIENFQKKNEHKFILKIIKINLNSGKGSAIQRGIKMSVGEYVLLQDADLELDTKDSNKMYQMIKSDLEIKCIFGSRYISGKLKRNNYFFNSLVGKINSLIFNIFFSQSLSDVHCGLKILHRDVINNIKLSLNDFGIEIDLASQIVRNNFFIYEYGVSYYFRTKEQGKKINWIDGLKSFYYLFKVRFVDNTWDVNISIIYSVSYMSYFGSHFGMGLGNTLFILFSFILGLIIGLKFKIFSSSLIFLFILIGSNFGDGEGRALSVFVFFTLSLFIAHYSKKFFSKSKNNYFI
tara:strand:+ start:1495 stop:2526 length:1032 start_codon:yes stop_codon:yes gene_type:complete